MINNEKKFNQYGEPGLEVQGIVIHNTSILPSAVDYENYYENECKTNQATHFVVDWQNVVDILPLDWKVYSTGKGQDWAFNHCISIDICSNINDDKYYAGERKAVELIERLMEEYNLTSSDIYFHSDFNNRAYCPSDILNRYLIKKNFIKNYFEKNKED